LLVNEGSHRLTSRSRIVGNRLRNNANGIEAWNVGGVSRIAKNLIQADQETRGAAFHVQPIEGTSGDCSANETPNCRPGILNLSAITK
jgi:hypothetical protein